MEKGYNIPYYSALKSKAETLDQLLNRALVKQNKTINQKYSNIENTVKILKNLIIEFTKRSDKLEKGLIENKKIHEIKRRDQYYKKRVEEYLEESDKLSSKLQNKRKKLAEVQDELIQMRKQLMRLKTNNIKKVMEIEDIEKFLEHEEIQEHKIAKKIESKEKKNRQRLMITAKNLDFSYEDLVNENQHAQQELYRKLSKFINLQVFINESYGLLLKKLNKNQQKSTEYGLSGTLFFKLTNIQDQKRSNNKRDNKLMIYDVLKQKYNRIKQQERRKRQEQIIISQQQFMKFSPLQIVGIIELKGGLQELKRRQWDLDNQKMYFEKLDKKATFSQNLNKRKIKVL